jgi:chromosome segregation ATPase
LKSTPQVIAISAIIALIALTSVSYYFFQMSHKVAALHSDLDVLRAQTNSAEVEISTLRATIEEMQSEIEELQTRKQAP